MTLLLAEGMLFILVALALGILVSARTSSQRVAMMGAMLGTMLPTQMLSGFIFPIESMPRVLQWLSNIVPAKWFVLIARGIMLKGVGLDVSLARDADSRGDDARAPRRQRALVQRAAAMSIGQSARRSCGARSCSLAPRCCTSCATARRSCRSSSCRSIQLLILSNVTTFAIRQSPVYVVDFDRSSASRGLVSRFARIGTVPTSSGSRRRPARPNDAMLRGRATLVVTIPRDFEAIARREGTAPVHLDVNAEKGSAAGIVQSYAAQILNAYSRASSARRCIRRARRRSTFRTPTCRRSADPA